MRSLLCAAAFLLVAYSVPVSALAGQTTNRDYPGLHLGGTDQQAVQRLVAHVKKCRSDSVTFRQILKEVGSRTKGSEKFVGLHGAWKTDSMIGHAGSQLGELFVDLSQLQVLPDPVASGHSDQFNRPLFDPLPHTPPWATTVCAWLGHEVAELLEDVVAGKRDRPVHHYQIANRKEDSIIWDYTRAGRTRGEDCGERHENHYDLLIEMKGDGVERFHMSRDRVNFSLDGTVRDVSASERLAYVEYQAGATFPGRQPESAVCMPPSDLTGVD